MLDREAVARKHSPERSLVEPAGVFIVAGNVAEQRLLEPVEGPGVRRREHEHASLEEVFVTAIERSRTRLHSP